jgi:methyl-accepting chemotaxis protein
MSLKKPVRFGRSLAARLTLWYAAIFSLCLGVAFAIFYLSVSSVFENQTDNDLLSRTRELESLFYVNGIDAVKRVAVLEAQAAGEKKIFVRLLYPNGTAFSSSNMSYWKNIPVSPDAVKQLGKNVDAVFETIVIPQRKHGIRVLYSVMSRGVILQLGQSMAQQARFFHAFRRVFIITMSFLILFSAFIGWFMARRATSGVEAVTKTAGRISQGNMDQRVPVNRQGDEIAQLAITFNRMLDRIQLLVNNIKEISDNIAHDLKSPVTRIRGLAEVTLTTAKTLPEFEGMAAGTIEECDRLLDMVNTMLMISRTESGVETGDCDPIDLSSLVHDACDLFGPMAEDKGISLS